MNKNTNTIAVNGQTYDATTGLPVAASAAQSVNPPVKKPATAPRKTTAAKSLHPTTQKSSTLRRPAAKKTATPTEAAAITPTIQPKKRPILRSIDIARHPRIGKFNSGTRAASSAPAPASTDLAPRAHPHALRAAQKQQTKKNVAKPTPKTAQQTKEAEIAKALAAKPIAAKDLTHKQPRSRHTRRIRIAAIITAALVLIAIVTWVNLPMLSIKVASIQSGIPANFPHFTPDGYRLKLPIDARDNRVAITFLSNQNDTSFTLEQEKSTWDSQAVRAMVEAQSKGQFLTTQDRGLTVYTYDGNASWVNKGTLYTITGNAPLSNDTIMRVASSL